MLEAGTNPLNPNDPGPTSPSGPPKNPIQPTNPPPQPAQGIVYEWSFNSPVVKGATVEYVDMGSYLVCKTCGALISKAYMHEHTKSHS